ncbi:MAG: TonB-dependent receptor [Ignavibacteriae bacterium]|nr:TonB-dependent receptor [Ignavibacteriota bacterium]
MRKLILLSIIIFGFYLVSDLKAQIDTGYYETEEVVITGTRTEKKIIDIPYSVNRIDQTQWQTTRKQAVNEVLSLVPGVFFQSRYGNHDVRISIRGFGSRSNSGIRGVRILLDGIPESEPDGQTRIEAIDFTAIGKIEVVKGNSSSLYTNAPGGVMNFLSDVDFTKNFALIDNDFGEYGLRKNGFKVGLNSGSTRFMLTSSYENYKGFRDHSEEYQTRINSTLISEISAKTTLKIFGYYVNGLIKLPGSQTYKEYTTNPYGSDATTLARDLKRVTRKGRIGVTYNTRFGKNDQHTIEITGYGTIKNLERTDSRYRIFSRSGLGASFKYINQMEIGKRHNEFTVGGDLFYQGGPMNYFDNVNGQKGDISKAILNEKLTNVGFYLLDQFSVIPGKLDFLLSGRYDRVTYISEDWQNTGADTSRTFDRVTPKVALNYKFTSKIAAYTSFGLGFDSPANNELDNYPSSTNGGRTTINPDLKGQKSTNFEVGIKGSLGGIDNKYFTNTFAEITFFHSLIQDEIVPFVYDNAYFYRNAGKTRRLGIEAGFNTDVIKGLTLRAAYTYSKFEYIDFKALTIISSPFQEVIEDYSNNIVPTVPENLLSTELGYSHTFEKYYTAFIKGNAKYVGSMYVNDKNVDSLKTEEYFLLGAQLGFAVNYKGYNVTAYAGVDNISDKKYVSYININDMSGRYYEAGPKRNFFGGLKFGYIFN